MALVKCGRDMHINPGHISSIEWDRRHYASGPGDTTLIITMLDGRAIRLRHEPHLMDGTNCYDVERELTLAALASPREPVEPTAEVVYRA